MIKNDRYTLALLVSVIGLILFIYLQRKEQPRAAGLSLLIGPVYLAWLGTRSGRIHLTDDQKRKIIAGGLPPGTATLVPVQPFIQFKSETGCGFEKVLMKDVDGLLINGSRYKVPNGCDVYLDDNLHLRPCGPGSALMIPFLGGGYEPNSIQNDKCWVI